MNSSDTTTTGCSAPATYPSSFPDHARAGAGSSRRVRESSRRVHRHMEQRERAQSSACPRRHRPHRRDEHGSTAASCSLRGLLRLPAAPCHPKPRCSAPYRRAVARSVFVEASFSAAAFLAKLQRRCVKRRQQDHDGGTAIPSGKSGRVCRGALGCRSGATTFGVQELRPQLPNEVKAET